jgi:hypothetical protein
LDRYRKSQLGGYLALFMWRRRCKALNVEPLEQIFIDLVAYFSPTAWRSLGEIGDVETTERKQRMQMKKDMRPVG